MRLCSVTGLGGHGVRHFQALEPQAVPFEKISAVTHVMFLVRNSAASAQLVAQHICEIKRCAVHHMRRKIQDFSKAGMDMV